MLQQAGGSLALLVVVHAGLSWRGRLGTHNGSNGRFLQSLAALLLRPLKPLMPRMPLPVDLSRPLQVAILGWLLLAQSHYCSPAILNTVIGAGFNAPAVGQMPLSHIFPASPPHATLSKTRPRTVPGDDGGVIMPCLTSVRDPCIKQQIAVGWSVSSSVSSHCGMCCRSRHGPSAGQRNESIHRARTSVSAVKIRHERQDGCQQPSCVRTESPNREALVSR